jgi:DNA-binding transcriptional ArsR family regulator
MQQDESLSQGAKSGERRPQSFFFFVYKKSEKVISAIYLVTNLMPFEEPLRWQVRHTALSLIGEILPLKDMGRSTHVEARIIPVISELLSLIEIGRSAELVSPMNAELISGELAELGRALKEQYGRAGGDNFLASDFFGVLSDGHHTALLEDVNSSGDKGQGADILKDKIVSSKGQNLVKDISDSSKGHEEKRKEIGASPSSPKELARERKSKILALLRTGNMLSVRDIGRAVGEVSEKTIQRDLNVLIIEGRVKQEGRRRWTRYSLRV